MSAPFGASPEEWRQWDLTLGATVDLLPVVCQPGLPIATGSVLKQYGKVPSRFTARGEVVGFPQWTSYQSSGEDVERWMGDSRLGICLQTRRLRAIDIDIEDAAFVAAILHELHLDISFPIRTRSGSSKCLLLFELPGEWPKQILRTPQGVIELLMNGQQCLVAGTHPSGSRYEWLTTVEPPLLSAAQFQDLKDLLEIFGSEPWTEGRRHVERLVRAATTLPDDDLARYLGDRHEIVTGRHPDRFDVVCPWASSHTSGDDKTATSYFFAGTNGFEQGAFRCLHGHCIDRTTSDFAEAVGWAADGFGPVVDEPNVSLQALLDGVETVPDGVSPNAAPHFDRDTKSGKIKPVVNNMLTYVRWLCGSGEGVGFDVFNDEVVLFRGAEGGYRPFSDADYTRLQARAERDGFMPLKFDLVRRAVHTVAQDHLFDSAQDWLSSVEPWDGVSRVDDFCTKYLGAETSAYVRAVGRYLWSAMAGRILSPGIQADMTLVLVSRQGTRKSSMIRALAPKASYYTEVSFSDKEDDIARLTKGKTLVELPELKGLRTREIEWIKAFVTKREHAWIPKYFEMRTTYARRFLMIGTTNDQEFLADPTGERRWLPVTVGRSRDEWVVRDHSQLWAEGRSLYLSGGILWQDAQALAEDQHEDYTVHDVLVDQIDRWLDDWDGLTTMRPRDCPHLLLLDVYKGVTGEHGKKVIPKLEQWRFGDALKRLGYERVVLWVEGKAQRVWVVQKHTTADLLGSVEIGGFDDLK